MHQGQRHGGAPALSAMRMHSRGEDSGGDAEEEFAGLGWRQHAGVLVL